LLHRIGVAVPQTSFHDGQQCRLFFFAEHNRKGREKILQRREALLTVDNMERVDANEALSLLRFEDGGPQKVGRWLVTPCPDVGSSRDIRPKPLPLVLLVPNVGALEEWNAILPSLLK
jgi:hypothetical protein